MEPLDCLPLHIPSCSPCFRASYTFARSLPEASKSHPYLCVWLRPIKVFVRCSLYYSLSQHLAWPTVVTHDLGYMNESTFIRERERQTDRPIDRVLGSKVPAMTLKNFSLNTVIEYHIENKQAVLLLSSLGPIKVIIMIIIRSSSNSSWHVSQIGFSRNQTLSWVLGCRVFIRDQRCERKEEKAGQGRGRRPPNSQPTWWGILR